MMTILIIACLIGSIGLAFVAQILILVAAFRTSILWGLAILFLPFAQFLFVISHWEDVRTAFLLYLVAVALFVVAFFSTPNQMAMGLPALDGSGPTDASVNTPSEESSFSFSKLTKKMEENAQEREMRKRTEKRGYTGRSLADIEDELGPPPAKFTKSDGSVHYGYSTLELISADGITVTDEIHR